VRTERSEHDRKCGEDRSGDNPLSRSLHFHNSSQLEKTPTVARHRASISVRSVGYVERSAGVPFRVWFRKWHASAALDMPYPQCRTISVFGFFGSGFLLGVLRGFLEVSGRDDDDSFWIKVLIYDFQNLLGRYGADFRFETAVILH
jgi:hypothetical protein